MKFKLFTHKTHAAAWHNGMVLTHYGTLMCKNAARDGAESAGAKPPSLPIVFENFRYESQKLDKPGLFAKEFSAQPNALRFERDILALFRQMV